MGGLWCFWLALDRPERVRAVVQFGCPAFILDTSPRLHLLIKIRRMLMRRRPSPELARRILQRVAGRAAVDAAPPELLEAVAALEAMSDHRIAALSLLELALRLRRQVPKLRLGEEELAALTQPVLFVWGEHDAFGDPAWGRRACALLANARMEEVAGGGHLPWLDDPELSAEAVTAFLGAEVGT